VCQNNIYALPSRQIRMQTDGEKARSIRDLVVDRFCDSSMRTVHRDLEDIRVEMPSTPSDDDKQGIVADLIAL